MQMVVSSSLDESQRDIDDDPAPQPSTYFEPYTSRATPSTFNSSYNSASSYAPPEVIAARLALLLSLAGAMAEARNNSSSIIEIPGWAKV